MRGHAIVQESGPRQPSDRGLGSQGRRWSLPTGPEYKSMKSCIYVGMASDDVDISELVETIAVTAREIEENSRVCKTNLCLVPLLGLLWAASWGHEGGSYPQKYVFVPKKCRNGSNEPSIVPGIQNPPSI